MMTNSLTILDWDSGFFGRCVGSLSLASPSLLENEIAFARGQGCQLIYIYSEEEIKVRSAENFRIIDVGGQIKFVKKLGGAFDFSEQSTNITQHTHSSASKDILELAYLSGQLSRFCIDPWLPQGSFEELYKAWIVKIIGQAPKASIYVYRDAGNAIGMITSEFIGDSCVVGLVAVQPSFQGQGIATQLMKYLESECIKQGIKSIEVKTQISNKKAQVLYFKNSFLKDHCTFLYHAHAHLL